MDQKCERNIFEEYMNQESHSEALEHMESCPECAMAVMQMENILPANRVFELSSNSQGLPGDENEMARLVEEFQKGGGAQASKLSAAQIMEVNSIASAIESFDSSPADAAPEYLLRIVRNRLEATQKANQKATQKASQKGDTSNSIVVNLKDRLRVMGEAFENIFVMPAPEAVTVRSSGVSQQSESGENPGYLHFYTNEQNGKKLVYHFVKDGSNTVMLTLKFQGYSEKPNSIQLKQNHSLVTTCPVTKDYAYFAKLDTGRYEMELKYNSGEVNRVNLDIISE